MNCCTCRRCCLVLWTRLVRLSGRDTTKGLVAGCEAAGGCLALATVFVILAAATAETFTLPSPDFACFLLPPLVPVVLVAVGLTAVFVLLCLEGCPERSTGPAAVPLEIGVTFRG